MSEFLDWVKMRSHLFRGVTFGTMLRDEAYHFIRLGTHLERADNTARILDVKYHTLLPSAADVGGAVDYYQWGALLRSVSGFESYRKIYSDVITPRRVAELLILRDDMPRSLHACMNFIHETLEMLCDDSTPRNRARRRASCTRELHYGRDRRHHPASGLHEYLMDFLERISALGDEISRHFLRRRRTELGAAIPVESRLLSQPLHAHDLLRRHVARRRDDLRRRIRAPTRASTRSRAFPRCAMFVARRRPRDRHAVVGQPVDHAERAQHARAAGARRRRRAATCGTRRRCSTSRALLGDALREVKTRDGPYLMQNNIDSYANFIVGGQIQGEPPRLFEVYSEGNFIEATPDTCYFQIGESKYGKPVHRPRDHARARRCVEATKCTIVSFDSTMRSNISVGPADRPRRSTRPTALTRQAAAADRGDPIRTSRWSIAQWGEGLRRVFAQLPDPDWT